jgi:VIT1/CCC1 family predicted Fe2+/Mn2+ transporter
MAMAAGEFVSVSSQADSEAADLEREARAIGQQPKAEMLELATIYEDRGLSPQRARQVAEQLMAKGGLAAHARYELGLTEAIGANPLLAAAASAIAFSFGAALPALVVVLAPRDMTIAAVSIAALIFVVALGALGARLGGAQIVKPALRVGFWGALAMAVTAGIGALAGKVL